MLWILIPLTRASKKMKFAAVLAATIAGSANAFAPAKHGTRTPTSMSVTSAQKEFFGLSSSMDFSKELGVQPPVRIHMHYLV